MNRQDLKDALTDFWLLSNLSKTETDRENVMEGTIIEITEGFDHGH